MAEVAFTLLVDGLETSTLKSDAMARYPRTRLKPTTPKAKPLPTWLAGTGAFAIAFSGTTYLLAPEAPGKPEIRREWNKRTKDQHYSGCGHARANHHEDIASWEPSYRAHMDGDGDGHACEPYR